MWIYIYYQRDGGSSCLIAVDFRTNGYFPSRARKNSTLAFGGRDLESLQVMPAVVR